jgi:signal transduction histidine kinase
LALASEIPVVFSDYLGLICLSLMLIVQFSAFREHDAAQIAAGSISIQTAVLLVAYSYILAGFGLVYKYLISRLTAARHEVARMAVVLDNISNTNLEYQNYVSTVERSAVEKERQRISREIHDIIGYTMMNTLMLIQAAQTSTDAEQIHMLLDKAQMHLSESVDEARLSLYKLRDEKLDILHGKELFSKLTKAFSDITGIKIFVDFGNLPEYISSDVEKVLFRIIEESMTNTFKHGNANLMTIHFLHKDDAISLRIFDNGTSRPASGIEIKEGIGLSGMRERLEPLHGTLSAEYVQDGFLLQVVIPDAES